MNEEQDLPLKISQFTLAIQNYLNHCHYKCIEKMVSLLIVLLQFITLLNLLSNYEHTSVINVGCTLILAYVATDFINGLVHLFMDNNTHYTSCIGPFIAAFHLHHAKYVYQKRPLLKVYFDESGTKFWLLAYLMFLALLQSLTHLPTSLNMGLVAFGILSSVAELSHYYCHNASDKNKLVRSLQKYRLLLSVAHHKAHHRDDNIQYAFLNGMTDPLINLIARTCYKGYKNHADKHTRAYMKQITGPAKTSEIPN